MNTKNKPFIVNDTGGREPRKLPYLSVWQRMRMAWRNYKKSDTNSLFFTGIIYDWPDPEETEQIPALLGWPRRRRQLYVLLFDWLKPSIRDRLGIR